ncbi:polysaccharide biosynthesis protein, partial [Escherichia coli]|nr:polysaccharide biosynthesis protein [Escherichia coli]
MQNKASRVKYYFHSKVIPFFLRGGGAALSFISTILVSRYLGAHDSGIYYVSLNIISILSVVANFGFNTMILKQVSDQYIDKSRESILISSSLYCALAIAFLFFALIFLIANVNEEKDLYWTLLLMSPAIFFMACSNSFASYLQAKERFTPMVIIQSFAVPAILIFCIWLLHFLNTIDYNKIIIISSIYLLSCILVFIYAICSAKAEGDFQFLKCSIKFKHGTFKYAMINIIIIALSQGVVIINGYFLSYSELSKVIVAQKIALLFNFVTTTIVMLFIPKMINSFKNNKKEFFKIARKCKKIAIITNALMAIVVYITADYIISIYGESFDGASVNLKILVLFQLINAYCAVNGSILLYIDNENILLKI